MLDILLRPQFPVMKHQSARWSFIWRVVLPIYMQLSTKCYLVIQNIHNKFVIMRKMAHDTEDNIDNNMIW